MRRLASNKETAGSRPLAKAAASAQPSPPPEAPALCRAQELSYVGSWVPPVFCMSASRRRACRLPGLPVFISSRDCKPPKPGAAPSECRFFYGLQADHQPKPGNTPLLAGRFRRPEYGKTAASGSSVPTDKAERSPLFVPGRERPPPESGTQSIFQMRIYTICRSAASRVADSGRASPGLSHRPQRSTPSRGRSQSGPSASWQAEQAARSGI